MRLVLLGLPGAGKGTQGERLAEKYSIPHISTGSLIRSVINSGLKLGEIVNAYIAKGNLIPDEYMMEILRQRVLADDCRNGWILDGFPRTVQQAKHLDEMLKRDSTVLDRAFDIRISAEEAVSRITNRRVCRSCGQIYSIEHSPEKVKGICDKCNGPLYQRPDDNVEVATHRIQVYMEQTHPVVHYYAQTGRLTSINGEQGIDGVFADLQVAVAELYAKKAGEEL
ncbi:MAG TPA: adenylate kinase [Firmicutes bacterium]|nr:adenylate kinase [Bacillota bacterium]